MRDASYRGIAAVRATRKTIVVPAFSYANTWTGVSELLARYSIGNTNPFTLRRPVEQPNETFVAAISWAESPYVYRYKLSDLGVLYFPLYTGQQIGSNAYLEIWNVGGEAVADIDDDWTLTCSKLVLPDLCQCIVNEESATLVPIVPVSVPAYTYCNPFCFPLCT